MKRVFGQQLRFFYQKTEIKKKLQKAIGSGIIRLINFFIKQSFF